MASPATTPGRPATLARRRRLSSFHRPALTPRTLPRTLHRPSTLSPLNPRSPHIPQSPSTPSTPTAPRITPTNLTPDRIPPTRLSPRPTPVSNRRRSTRRPALSHDQITAMYAETIKLCQHNKINARNTWTLNLIDYMPMLFKPPPASTPSASTTLQDTNFQLAGVTLDAGVRIYCSRVDSVHTNAFKVLGGLSRTGAPLQDPTNPDHFDDDPHPDTTRRRPRRTGRATLEQNIPNITAQKLETDLAVDPLFHKMSAAFDEGGAKGMLLNNLPVGPRGQVVFDSAELADSLVALSSHAVSDVDHLVYDVADVLPATPPGPGDAICAGFLSFFRAKKALLDRVKATGGEELADTASGDITGSGGGEYELHASEPDFDYSSGDLQNADAMGVFAGSDPPADSAFSQERSDDDDEVNISWSIEAQQHSTRHSLESNQSLAFAARRGSLDLVEAGVALSESSEYSFFDPSTISGWAGPQHWRFRAVEAMPAAPSGGTKNSTKSKRPRGKTAMLLDFSSGAPEINFAKEFAQGKKAESYHLSKTVQEALSEKKVTLPEDLHFSVRSLASLFLKPRAFVRPKEAGFGTPRAERSDNAGDGWYDFENDCDNENFCPDNGDILGNLPDEQGMQDDTLFTAEIDLIPEPTRVEKIDINYAKVAKKVDVRQLKSGMWSQLCGGREVSEDPENVEDDPKVDSDRISAYGGTDIRQGMSQTLQDVVHELAAFVPETSLPDVSLPYVFICLLHLANEKTLKISQAENSSLRDLIITSGSGENE